MTPKLSPSTLPRWAEVSGSFAPTLPGRYTHRVAISNNRLLNIDRGKVSFRWKDYRHDRQKIMTLEADEFIRRFLLHVLPDGFLGQRYRQAKAALCRQLQGVVLTLARPPQAPPPIAISTKT